MRWQMAFKTRAMGVILRTEEREHRRAVIDKLHMFGAERHSMSFRRVRTLKNRFRGDIGRPQHEAQS